ncbi:MAG: lipid asymmetry maintenance protein MlaB [Spirochaetales bacterium]
MADKEKGEEGSDTSQTSGKGVPDVKVVSPGSHITVDQVQRLKSEILSAFGQSTVVSVPLSNVERIDLAGVHLLYGAKREAAKQGKTFRITGTLQQHVGEMLVASGFCRSVPANANELADQLLEFEPRPVRPSGGDDQGS